MTVCCKSLNFGDDGSAMTDMTKVQARKLMVNPQDPKEPEAVSGFSAS